jgi:hypothetical protein
VGFKTICIFLFIFILAADFVSAQQTSDKKRKSYKKLIQKPYSTFEGKVIRHISITTLDPFGYVVDDSLVEPANFIPKAGNRLHLQTRQSAIRNLLLVKENQLFDSLVAKESERLIRSQKYVRDVTFFIIATSGKSDSVDIFIRELDTWSLIPTGSISNENSSISLADRNFTGMGHETKLGFSWNHNSNDFAYFINYFVPSISKTFINSTLHYGTDESGNFAGTFDISRPFFSPLTKWAAGINFSRLIREDFLAVNDSLIILQRFKSNTQDYWAGYAINIFKGQTPNRRTTNLITAARFLRVRYLEKPAELYDLQHIFADEQFYLASIGISTRKYVQDKYIFLFGIPEDIPIGKVYSLTVGYQEKNSTSRVYAGARVSFGYYHTWGYLSANFEFGTFFRSSQRQQGVFSANIIYFTGLVELGKWKFRQFVKPQVIIGSKRFAYDSLTLNDGYGLNGFKSNALKGTSRILFTVQTQSYAPWEFLGFRFGPFINCTLGILGDETYGFKNRQVYAQIGLGILIKNDYLVLNAFQLSISFYPVLPGGENGLFKFNSYRTSDFGFGDFDIEKPAIVRFQ